MGVREYDAKAKLWLCDTCGEWNLPEDDTCQVCDDPKHLPPTRGFVPAEKWEGARCELPEHQDSPFHTHDGISSAPKPKNPMSAQREGE